MADSVSSWRLLEAGLRHDGPAGQRHLAATFGETRFRPSSDLQASPACIRSKY